MGESTKAVCAVLLIAGILAAVMAWMMDRPGTLTWTIRIGAPLVSLLALGLILKLQFRADIARDYLRDRLGSYFNRDGFCFAFAIVQNGEVAYMDAYFQSQYEGRSVGKIALRPARGFFMTRAKIDLLAYEIECEPAAFGVARLAFPVPEGLQGKRQAFEVGALVAYPNGKGGRVRFRDGIFIRANSNFRDSFGTMLVVAGAATGQFVISKPAIVKILLPTGVKDEIPSDLAGNAITLWRLGDPPLEGVGAAPVSSARES